MKFSSSLKFNAVSEWWDEYIAYDTLKKYIYQLEKQQYEAHAHPTHPVPLSPTLVDLEANEQSALLSDGAGPEHGPSATDTIFIPLLDRELKKIVLFYESQEKELLDELAELEEAVAHQDEMGLDLDMRGWERYEDGTDDDEDDDSVTGSPTSRSPDGGRVRRGSITRHRKSSSAGRTRSFTVAGGTSALPTTVPEHTQDQRSSWRRASISSLEDHQEDPSEYQGEHEHNILGDSIASLRRSPRGTIGRLAGKLTNLKDSITSSIHPIDPSGASGPPGAGTTIWNARTDYAYDTRLLFKRRITNLFIAVTNLRSYVEINYSGFRKIIKKYDKVTDSSLKAHYLHTHVEPSAPFTQASKDRLGSALALLIELYAKCVTHNDKAAAKSQLRLHQRENIAWERDTVWRQMIGRERRGEGGEGGALPGGASLVKLEEEGDGLGGKGGWRIAGVRLKKKWAWGVFALAVFGLLLCVDVVRGGGVEANRCFAVLMFCTLLWATEAIPLFVTSLFVPLLLVILRVIRDDEDVRLPTPLATKYVFSVMFSPTIMLLIGGFTISSALSKTNIDRVLITRVLALAGTKPRTVLLAFMGVSCFASMWISNVAAPTLCFTLIRPILRTLPPGSTFGPCLILAIALAANIGGQSSPISSPQNLIALAEMDPKLSWGSWFAVALPVSAISIILIWILLLASYRPARSPDGEGNIEIKAIRPTKEAFTGKQYWVSFVTLLTIGLWCVEHQIEDYVGDMGVIALIPVLAFFSTGVLKKDDFEHFAWTIVFLAMGGIALGKGVMSSGLLEVMDGLIRDLVDGFSLYSVVLILSPVVLIISTFISHTIASVLLVPIAKEVGSNLPGNHQNLLIFITGLICSTGMGMPVSGFPNQTAATQEDELGELYLTNVDFLKNGVPASIIATLVVSTVGFLLMRLIDL